MVPWHRKAADVPVHADTQLVQLECAAAQLVPCLIPVSGYTNSFMLLALGAVQMLKRQSAGFACCLP